MNKFVLILFRLGLFKAALVSAYHFYLPTHFYWHKGLEQTPQILSWTLRTLNFDWSLIMLLCALMLLWFSVTPNINGQIKRQVCLVYASYWLVHSGYLVLNPAPFPASMQWIGSLFVGFAFITTGLIFLGAWVFKSPQTSVDGESMSKVAYDQ